MAGQSLNVLELAQMRQPSTIDRGLKTTADFKAGCLTVAGLFVTPFVTQSDFLLPSPISVAGYR
jgi:hypothetical protein